MFFQSEDETKRKAIEVFADPHDITGGSTDMLHPEGSEFIGMEPIKVDVKYV